MNTKVETVWRQGSVSASARATQKIDEENRRAAIKTAAKDSKVMIGPLVLGLFMFCILCNCLLYVYHAAEDMLAPSYVAAVKDELVHDYQSFGGVKLAHVSLPPVRSPAMAAAPASPAAKFTLVSMNNGEPLTTWHRVAAGDDVDYLRIALRTSFATTASSHGTAWKNPANGDHGIVMQTGSGTADCRRFHITRQDGTDDLSDTVDFCTDGSIRQAAP